MSAVDGPTGERLRETLEALAETVHAEPVSYRQASAGWRRRSRRRRLVLAVVASVAFAVADGVGLWALSRADPDTHVIFSDPRPAPAAPQVVDGVGQP